MIKTNLKLYLFPIVSLTSSCLTPALHGIVIGYWAQDGKFNAHRHCIGQHHNLFVGNGQTDLIKCIIEFFSFEGQSVIDGVPNRGTAVIIESD